MINTEERLEIAHCLKRSLEEQLGDIKGFHIDVEHRGDAVLWRYGKYNGTIPIIGRTDSGTVILEFPQCITSDRNGSYHSSSSMRTLLNIYDIIENYLSKHGEKQENPHRNPTYNFRRGIPF